MNDKRFLKSLDSKLKTKEKKRYNITNVFLHRGEGDFFYKDAKMNVEEMERIAEICKKRKYFHYAARHHEETCYKISWLDPFNREHALLSFVEKQLPEGYNFRQFSDKIH